MALSNSFIGMLKTLSAAENKPQRHALTLLFGGVSQEFGDEFGPNSRAIGVDRGRAEAHMSLVMAVRTLWTITPEKLFTGADPNFERLAEDALASLDAATKKEDAVLALSRVFRHLRSAHLWGRSTVSGLNLRHPKQERILAAQGGRCAICRYHFLEGELENADDDDEIFTGSREAKPDEVALGQYQRRPVLDHIVPYFLGGDGPENWQILCHSCNTGKGEGLAWILRRGLLPPGRPSDALKLTPSLRHAVLANYHAGEPDLHNGGELRLYRRDQGRLPVFDNLIVRAD